MHDLVKLWKWISYWLKQADFSGYRLWYLEIFNKIWVLWEKTSYFCECGEIRKSRKDWYELSTSFYDAGKKKKKLSWWASFPKSHTNILVSGKEPAERWSNLLRGLFPRFTWPDHSLVHSSRLSIPHVTHGLPEIQSRKRAKRMKGEEICLTKAFYLYYKVIGLMFLLIIGCNFGLSIDIFPVEPFTMVAFIWTGT